MRYGVGLVVPPDVLPLVELPVPDFLWLFLWVPPVSLPDEPVVSPEEPVPGLPVLPVPA